jgi:CRP/FNR family cyclic AMP-dependent transcriptional regulator
MIRVMVEINLFKSSPDAYDVEAGGALFTEGEPGDVMYAVIEGQIDVTLAGAATATATVTSRVARIDKKHFMFLVQEHPTFALQVMAVMADRLRHANEARTGS